MYKTDLLVAVVVIVFILGLFGLAGYDSLLRGEYMRECIKTYTPELCAAAWDY